MKNSRSLEDLHPAVRRRVEAFLASAKGEGIDLLVTSTYRDFEAQQALYEQGRVSHCGVFAQLEDQLTTWSPDAGTSPDRLDALVWALTETLLSDRQPVAFL